MRKAKLYIVSFLIIAALAVVGTFYLTKDGKVGQVMSHLKSSFIGLNRVVEVYNYGSNTPVKVYHTQTQIEYPSPTITRFLAEGKTINITGGLVISEEQ